MNIPWKFKSLIFSSIDFFDAPKLLYFLQKHITKRSQIKLLNIDPVWLRHKKALVDHDCTKFSNWADRKLKIKKSAFKFVLILNKNK
jgi:hypothetical protein